MPKFLDTKSLYYNDVNLIAQPSKLKSRKDIPEELSRIIVSPMDAVVGETFAVEALNLGLTVCLPRFSSIEDQKRILHNIYDKCGREYIESGLKKLYISIGLNDETRIKELKLNYVLIDVANGYIKNVVDFAEELVGRGYNVMCGNVHSANGFNLYNKYVKLRVGIGQGTVCKTSTVTGYTRGQISEILDCYNNRKNNFENLIADGGIINSGYAAKAFGAGADFVMMGGYFSKCEEAKNIINKEYSYWGGASEKQQIKFYGEVKRLSEGTEININKSEIKPLNLLVKDLWDGIASAVSYSGKNTLTNFIGNGVFEIKENSLIK